MSATILTTLQNGILQLCLNRPDVMNAINLDMYQSLATEITNAENNPDVRVILLSGSGGNFCSGNDLEDFVKTPPVKGQASPTLDFMQILSRCKKPVVAAVEGAAVGIGVTMLLHCDLVYVSHDAKMQLPFCHLGVVPEFASTYLLPKLVGYQRAAKLLLLGERFSGLEAVEMGIACDSAETGNVVGMAQEACEKLAALPASRVQQTKQLMNAEYADKVESVMMAELDIFVDCIYSEEFKEAVSAFSEKRKPDFSRFN